MRPTLAATFEPDQADFPYLASPKWDGMRCFMFDGAPRSRTMEAIPNTFVRNHLKSWAVEGLDGELVTLTDGKVDDVHTIQSKLMSEAGNPHYRLVVFDFFAGEWAARTYRERIAHAMEISEELMGLHGEKHLAHVTPKLISDRGQLDTYCDHVIDDLGMEGVVLRKPDLPYIFARSTMKNGALLRVKRWREDEAEIVGFAPRMKNNNPAQLNGVGYTKRSSAKAGKTPLDTLGKLVCKWRGVEFAIGTGWDAERAQQLWSVRARLVGQKVTFRYYEVGSKGAPKSPSFVGIRYDIV